MALSVSIRLLRVDEAPVFRALRIRAVEECPDLFHSTAKEAARPIGIYAERIRSNRVFGLFVDGVPEGTAVLATAARYQSKRSHKAEVWNLYVTTAHRGRGLGQALLQAVIEDARESGYAALVLSVTTGDSAARRLYEKVGFVCYGTERRAMRLNDRYTDEDLMELWMGDEA